MSTDPSSASERSPLLHSLQSPPSSQDPPPSSSSSLTTPEANVAPHHSSKQTRTVSFDPNPVTRTFEVEALEHRRQRPRPSSQSPHGLGGAPVMAALNLNSKLRRRNSSTPSGTSPASSALVPPIAPVPKIGPQRTTKNAQKLKILPNPEVDDGDQDYESGRDVYSQYTRIKDPTARRDAARLGKADRNRLPRVTAYSTAEHFNMEAILRFLKGKKKRGGNPKFFDECIYSPYSYTHLINEVSYSSTTAHGHGPANDHYIQHPDDPVQAYERRHSTGSDMDGNYNRTDLLNLSPENCDDLAIDDTPTLDTKVHTPEVFVFEYGVVVIWGMSEIDEKRFLKEIAKFEIDPRSKDAIQLELFNFYYTNEYQARIYNDFITLRDRQNYMIKLAISHALAQSVQTSLFEDLVGLAIEECKDIPSQIALTGKIDLSRRQINMAIADLFNLRIGIHLTGSVLDTPELFWTEPHLEPVYQAVREYLELDQRLNVLTDRLDVIADLLAVLKEQLSHGHGEMLEWIVIILVAMEVVVATINIIVDLYVSPE
ncbi:sporulation protein rmd1 [Ceratocystis pirilliformis]|uniref:Sporulation protein rmd1 n=1 Tax=Ceratocystis pirilliformis TaxID=259994 RepID=A0ABR3ZLB1_9PEZI